MAGNNGDGTARNSALSPAVDWERLARANTHPLRISILEILGIDGGRTLSPIAISCELRMPLSNTNYHVTELHKSGLIDLDSTRRVRGATEHFYRLANHSLDGQIDSRDKSSPARPRAPRQQKAPQRAKR